MRTIALVLVGLVLSAGCGGASTPEGLTTLARSLHADGKAVLSGMAGNFGGESQEVVMDASQDQECEDGGTRRVFEATATVTAKNDQAGSLGLVETTLIGWFEQRGYRIERFPTNDSGPRHYTLTKKRLEFSASVESGRSTSYEIAGRTPCLG